MSAKASGVIWEMSRAKGSALLVLLAIADVADEKGRNAWCGSKHLAAKTRLSDREIRRLFHKLEKAGELVIEANTDRRPAPRGNTVPVWWLHLPCVFDPDVYARGKPDNLSETKFPVGRRSIGQVDQLPAAEISTRNRTSCPRNRTNRVDQLDKSRTAYKEGSVSDPLMNLEQGAAPPADTESAGAAPRSLPENDADKKPEDAPADNIRVITKLVHECFDILGFQSDDREIGDWVKDRCAELKILYDTEVTWKAIDSARFQRRRRLA